MLRTPTESEVTGKRRLGRERRLWHYEEHATTPLGCPSCPDRNECGGLRSKAAIFDCLDLCCGQPAQCDNVCRNNPTYAFRVREVEGFSLNTITATAPAQIAPPVLPSIVPLIYHGSGRREKIAVSAVAASLYEVFRRTDGTPRYTTREALCAALGIASDATIILSGTHNDRPLEGWWVLGEAGRRAIMKNLRSIGVSLVTSPNYSLFTDIPRWNDLHSIKRIAITDQEFLSEGLAAALHVIGTDRNGFQTVGSVPSRAPGDHAFSI
jgi:hypothetical protein